MNGNVKDREYVSQCGQKATANNTNHSRALIILGKKEHPCTIYVQVIERARYDPASFSPG